MGIELAVYEDDAGITKALIALAKSLNLKVSRLKDKETFWLKMDVRIFKGIFILNLCLLIIWKIS